MAQRETHVSAAIRWCALSVGWAAIAGISAIIAGFAAGAIALVAFGADSITDGSASAVLVWRFRRERSGSHELDRTEHRAALAVGAILIVIGIYVSASAIAALADHATPEHSPVGLALTAASVLVLPALARAKLRLAGPLHSGALRGDGILSLAGAGLATGTLASLGLNAAFGWWWSDAVAALIIASFLLSEGTKTSRTAHRELNS
ncbi:MAG TPA: cation transporter [Solirubrobacteraceae bacterium]|nr:cation transporter [Solirubrobacteraceae bacterium]